MAQPKSQQAFMTAPKMEDVLSCSLERPPTPSNSSASSGQKYGYTEAGLACITLPYAAPGLGTQPSTFFWKAQVETSLNMPYSLNITSQGTLHSLLSHVSGWKEIQQAIYHQIKGTAIKIILDRKERSKFDLTCRDVFWAMITSLNQLPHA